MKTVLDCLSCDNKPNACDHVCCVVSDLDYITHCSGCFRDFEVRNMLFSHGELYCSDCLDLAAAPVQDVPTPSGSSLPQIPNADKLGYRQQTISEKDQSALANCHCRWCGVPDSALASSGVAAPVSVQVAYYLVVINGFYVARINPVRIYQYDLTSSQSLARKFRTQLQLKYLGKLTDFLDSINHPYQVQVWRDCSIPLSTEEQSK